MRENLIGRFLDNLDIDSKGYYILLFILGVLIVITLYVDYKIKTENEVLVIDKTEMTVRH